MTEIYTVATAKGGCLKTSLTVNLAGELSKQGKKVLIIEIDGQGNASHSFNINPEEYKGRTIAEVLYGEIELDYAVVQAYENIDIIPAWREMSFFDLNAIKLGEPLTLLQTALKQTDLEKWDLVLIDTPPHLGMAVLNAFAVSDKIIVPFQPEEYGAQGLTRTLQELYDFKVEYNLKMEIAGVVGTLVDGRVNMHSENIQKARRWCEENEIKMFDTIISKSIVFPNAINYHGLPATLAPMSNRKDIRDIISQYATLCDEVFKNEGAIVQ